MHYVLERDISTVIVGNIEELNPGFGLKYVRGVKLKPEDEPKELKILIQSKSAKLPDFFEFDHVPIVSKKVVDVLHTAGVDNFDAYNAPVIENGRNIAEYWVLNIVGLVDCIDRTRCVVTEYEGEIARMKMLAVDEAKVGASKKLFRPQGFELIAIVSDGVRDALQGCTGAILTEAQGWSDEHLFAY